MNLAPPIRRLGRGIPVPDTGPAVPRVATDRTVSRTPTRTRSTGSIVRRERHQADYMILVVVIALSAIGILMVYSSSAIRGYLSADADTFATVGPQIQWAVLGIVAMVVMMRVDYRYLRLASIPFYGLSMVLLALVFVPSLGIVVGGSARWLRLGPLPAIHPAEIAKLALVIYLAHWFAKRGTRVRGLWGGTAIFLVIITPVIAMVFREPDLGTTMVLTLTAFTMFFVAGANLVHLGVMVAGAFTAMILAGLQGYQTDRIRAWLDPWADKLGDGFQTVQGLLALGVGGIFGNGLGQSQVSVPNAFNDFVFAEIGQEFGLIGGVGGHPAVPGTRVCRHPGVAPRARHVRGPACGRHHGLAVHPGLHQHRRRRGALPDHGHHTAVRQCRWLVTHHQLRGDRDPVVDLARDHREGIME